MLSNESRSCLPPSSCRPYRMVGYCVRLVSGSMGFVPYFRVVAVAILDCEVQLMFRIESRCQALVYEGQSSIGGMLREF